MDRVDEKRYWRGEQCPIETDEGQRVAVQDVSQRKPRKPRLVSVRVLGKQAIQCEAISSLFFLLQRRGSHELFLLVPRGRGRFGSHLGCLSLPINQPRPFLP